MSSKELELLMKDLEESLIELQLIDGSIRKPYGRVNDVSIKVVDGLEFLIDFILTDMKVTRILVEHLFILGRPFLVTANVATNF
ncbi:unnamed protein product [Spirodela intermedia]|uniref:Uncharacterized protein n=1 Tax=Spirodela intermedia TaxID=51605 RepID=A0ABN7E941_SPIIN|nr:unnamed protein product [Spirodela intermedia]